MAIQLRNSLSRLYSTQLRAAASIEGASPNQAMKKPRRSRDRVIRRRSKNFVVTRDDNQQALSTSSIRPFPVFRAAQNDETIAKARELGLKLRADCEHKTHACAECRTSTSHPRIALLMRPPTQGVGSPMSRTPKWTHRMACMSRLILDATASASGGSRHDGYRRAP